MCDDPACNSEDQPPAGESWCARRLGIEAIRWFTGHPMSVGPNLDLRPVASRGSSTSSALAPKNFR